MRSLVLASAAGLGAAGVGVVVSAAMSAGVVGRVKALGNWRGVFVTTAGSGCDLGLTTGFCLGADCTGFTFGRTGLGLGGSGLGGAGAVTTGTGGTTTAGGGGATSGFGVTGVGVTGVGATGLGATRSATSISVGWGGTTGFCSDGNNQNPSHRCSDRTMRSINPPITRCRFSPISVILLGAVAVSLVKSSDCGPNSLLSLFWNKPRAP